MNKLKMTVLAVLMCLITVPVFAEDPDYSVWRRTRGPDKQMVLQQRPDTVARNGWPRVADAEAAQAETVQEIENGDPPAVPQGEPGGCSGGDMFVSERGTLQAVDRNKWKDFIQNTSYVHVEVHNTKDEDFFITDGRPGALAKGVCSGAIVWFSFRRTKWSKKDRAYVALFATSMRDRTRRYRSLMIPLWRDDTRTYEWPIDEFRVASRYANQNLSDTYPSVLEFQPDSRDERLNEERDRKIDCKLYPYECYYDGYYGYGRGYGYGRTVGRPFFDTNPFRHLVQPPYVRPQVMPGCNLNSVEDCIAQEEFLPRIPRSGVMPYRRIGGNPVHLPQAGWHVAAGGAVRAGGSIRGGGAVRCSDPRCFSGYDNRRPPVFKTY